jgi:pyruvate dehydrogenase E2 component (dihydrolipoamide acetyltransferase)
MSSSPSDGTATMGNVNAPVDTVELTVPDLGPASDHAVVVSWAKSLGDRVSVDEPICRLAVGELEFDVHSTADGELARVLVEQGSRILEHSSLAEVTVAVTAEPSAPVEPAPAAADPMEDAGEGTQRQAPAVEIESIQAEPIDPEFAPADPVVQPRSPRFPSRPVDPEGSTAEGAAPAFGPDAGSIEAEPPAPMAEPPPSLPEAQGPVPSGDDVDWSVWISPVVQMLAEEHGIDLAEVHGTGVGGRIRKRDVLRHVASNGSAGDA